MKTRLRYSDIFIIIAYLFIGIAFILNFHKINEFQSEYIVLLISYFIIGFTFIFINITRKIDTFNPFVIISLLYIALFSVSPIVFILIEKTTLYGVNYMDGCTKMTLIYMFSYICFSIGFLTKKINIKKKQELNYKDLQENKRRKIVKIAILIWLFGVFWAYITLFASGRSIMYILTAGLVGSKSNALTDAPLGAFSNFQFFMIIPWLYICFLSKSKLLKIITTIISTTCFLAIGFRFGLLIMAISFLISFYKLNHKKPSIVIYSIIGVLLIMMITVVGSIRNDLSKGTELDFQKINFNTVLFSLESNFNIYQPLYAIVENYPQKYDYTFGKSMIVETATRFVPRIIWESKPLAIDSSVSLAMRRSVSDEVILNAAMAIPNIGEFYIDFGIFGCLILMYFFGMISKWTTKFLYSNNYNEIILYSVILPLYFQFIIRGSFAANFYLILFVVAPYFVIETLINDKKRIKF